MKIKHFEFSYIKAFKSLKFDLQKTSTLIGQNDHGKSSILKAIDIILNQLDDAALDLGVLHPDLTERLLPLFPVNSKARRITITYSSQGVDKLLHITIRTDQTFTILETIERSAKTTPESIIVFKKLREHNQFVLIPAMRDATSPAFQDIFSRMLRVHGLAKIIPDKAGGTPKEYRKLKEIRDSISTTIKPFINAALLPKIEEHFGYTTQHKLALKFDVDVQDIGEWILDNLSLGFEMPGDGEATLALSEAGSGVQSGVLLALHRVEHQAAANPDIQYILAVEEPEAFLHPQKQKELYQGIRAAETSNLRVIVTTHSPYIISETPFTRLGLIKKDGQHSALHVAEIKNQQEQETFDAYSDEVNSSLFFADKIVLVEGESDARVIKLLLEKKLGALAHRISILSASGNKNFSPFLRMIRAWSSAKIPHLIVTDFDSLTKSTDRAILTGAKDAGYTVVGEAALLAKVDAALDKGEAEFSDAASHATALFSTAGLNVFVFTSDLEYSLITTTNKATASAVLTALSTTGNDFANGYSVDDLRRKIGSKGVPMKKNDEATFKKPFVHRKIADSLILNNSHPDIVRLISAIEAL